MKRATLTSGIVSRETASLLARYRDELEKWNAHINLVSNSTLPLIWERHFEDSAQLAHQINPSVFKWVDLGSGGGFPGLVVAVLAKDLKPDLAFVLIEKDRRKAEFLRHILRLTQANATIICERVEDVIPQNADIVSARALAPVSDLISMAEPHLSPSGFCLFPKGRSVDSELTDAGTVWHMNVQKIPSCTNTDSTILRIENIRHV